MNLPKRVPVLANPQEGSSIRNVSSAEKTCSLVDEFMGTSLANGRYSPLCAEVTPFLGSRDYFAQRNDIFSQHQMESRHNGTHRSGRIHNRQRNQLWSVPTQFCSVKNQE